MGIIKTNYIKLLLRRYIFKRDAHINLELISKQNNKNVFLINNKFILKNASRKILKSEFFFLTQYNYLPYEKVIWYGGGRYILYNFFNAKFEHSTITRPESYLMEIHELVTTYKSINKSGYGYITSLKNSWQDFLLDEIEKRSNDMKEKHEEKKTIAIKQVTILEKFNFEKKLLHGDLGFYNIMFYDGKINGIIDPIGILGDPLFDYIYFSFSKPSFLEYQQFLKKVIIISGEPIEKVKAMMYIVLYIRISIEERYSDKNNYVERYEKIWEKI